jgi:hypothetical protein
MVSVVRGFQHPRAHDRVVSRSIRDDDGPVIARSFYENLFQHDVIDADTIAYALDDAVRQLRESGVEPERWAPFVHMGA